MFSIPCLKPDDPHAHPSPITASSSQLAYTGNVNGVYWDFPSGPVVKTLPFNAGRGGGGVIPSVVRELGDHIAHSRKHKALNRSNIITNSIKT